jgi:hypothetical protein
LPASTSYKVEGFDATRKFQQLQLYAIESANTTGFILESNAELVLALSSILLNKPGQHSSGLLKFFTVKELSDIHHDLLTSTVGEDYKDVELSLLSKIKAEACIKKLLKRGGSRITATVELSSLLHEVDSLEQRPVQSLITVVLKLSTMKLLHVLANLNSVVNSWTLFYFVCSMTMKRRKF